MYQNLPQKISLTEVGPRDGFQFETEIIPTNLKVGIISGLADAGLRRIQVTSFVNPGVVPQMADAEELIERLPRRKGVTYTGLVLNTKGVERAHAAGLEHVEISISSSDTHSRKNAGMSLEQAVEQGDAMIRLAQKHDIHITAGIQCAFGCVYQGETPVHRVLDMARNFMHLGVHRLSIADTTGMANPLSVSRLTDALLPETDDIPVGLHLHDTRGLGLANVMAAMSCGITDFDTALAGMGGCPFVTGAAGNIATEDTAYLMKSLGIDTGIDIPRLSECSKRLARFFGKQFPGKLYRLSS